MWSESPPYPPGTSTRTLGHDRSWVKAMMDVPVEGKHHCQNSNSHWTKMACANGLGAVSSMPPIALMPSILTPRSTILQHILIIQLHFQKDLLNGSVRHFPFVLYNEISRESSTHNSPSNIYSLFTGIRFVLTRHLWLHVSWVILLHLSVMFFLPHQSTGRMHVMSFFPLETI